MIFATVGTEKFQFDRLIRVIDEAVIGGRVGNDVFAQVGCCQYRPRSIAYKEFISFGNMVENIKKADIVVCHAGVGSTILSLNLGKVPIIFPRKHELGEHLDNHQMEFAKKMESTQKTIVAYNEEDLIFKINDYHKILAGLNPKTENSKQDLINYLKKICNTE